MLEHASNDAPAECCGLLGGFLAGALRPPNSDRVITEAFRVANAFASSNEYSISPDELIGAFRRMRELGLTHLGIYHSHPHSENFPSRRDIDLAYYPSCAYFIVAPREPRDRAVRAFEIRGGFVTELEIEAFSGNG